MGAPASPVDICNMAADLIGEAPINVIDPPNTETEKLFARHYDQVRQECLTEFDFNFSKKRDTCSLDSTWTGSTKFDYDDRYTLPNDCLKVLSVGGESEIEYEADFDISERYILIDNSGAASLAIRYVADVTDVSKMSAGFRVVFIHKLALRCCFQLTKKAKVQEALDALLEREMPWAVSVDGQERPPRRRQRSKYRDIRTRNSTIGGVHPKYTVFD